MLQPLSDQDSGFGELIEPPPSLWRLVEDLVPRSERAEIKSILGEAAVDLSLDLHAEMEVLLDLWREIRSTYPSGHQSPLSCSVLADPPVIKDMVTQEIRMLLLSVRRKARHQGLDEDQALYKYNPKVVSFVMGTGQPESRARSRKGGWSRPLSGLRAAEERPFSSLSTGSSIEDDLEDLKDKLKISDIDEIVLHLRSLLEDECRTLEKDIAALQQRLEEDYLDAEDVQTLLPEPSLTELKEERRIIERDLQLNQLSVTSLHSPKMASTRITKPARLLDDGRRGSAWNQDRRLFQKITTLSGLQHHEAALAPCPTDPRQKVPDKEKVSRGFSAPGVPSAALPVSLMKGPEERPAVGQGLDATHTPGTTRSLEQICRVHAPSHHPGQGPPSAPAVGSGSFLPAQNNQHRLGVTSLDTVFVPAPPPAQRPTSGASSVSSFRRLKTQVTHLPS